MFSVNPVNDSPVISSIENQTIDEDTSLIIDLSASDVDEDILVYSATNGDSEIIVDGTTLTIIPPANYFGTDDVTVTVTDGDDTAPVITGPSGSAGDAETTKSINEGIKIVHTLWTILI